MNVPYFNESFVPESISRVIDDPYCSTQKLDIFVPNKYKESFLNDYDFLTKFPLIEENLIIHNSQNEKPITINNKATDSEQQDILDSKKETKINELVLKRKHFL